MGAVETCDEIGARSHDGRPEDGRPPRQFARQNVGDVTLWDFHLSLWSVVNSFSTTNLRVGTRVVCTRETEPLRERQRARIPESTQGLLYVRALIIADVCASNTDLTK
eukprot:6189066-Pleurochrysis_carterae.AAC.2